MMRYSVFKYLIQKQLYALFPCITQNIRNELTLNWYCREAFLLQDVVLRYYKLICENVNLLDDKVNLDHWTAKYKLKSYSSSAGWLI